ncbi:hypothetical protein BJ138DRAFT_1120826, partial [Hygrophoropsis aurantiaca]
MPSSQVPRQNFSALQYPCGYPGCQRVLKTTGGRTKHRDSAHPPFIPPPTQFIDPDTYTTNGGARQNDDEEMTDGDFDGREEDHGGEQNAPMDDCYEPAPHSSPIPEVESHFYGPGNKLYRNYHTALN